MDNQSKDHIDQERYPQRNHPKQLQAHKVSTDNAENTNGTNKGRDLQIANKLRIIPRGIERMLQMIQRHQRATLHWSTQPQRVQDETKKSSYGMHWQQKGIWYSPVKLDNELPRYQTKS